LKQAHVGDKTWIYVTVDKVLHEVLHLGSTEMDSKKKHAEANGGSAIRALSGQLLATLRASGELQSLFRAIGFLWRIRVFPERELIFRFLTGRLGALDAALARAEGEMRGLDAHLRALVCDLLSPRSSTLVLSENVIEY
jgi:hypothetical protein